ncbi:pectinesterase family protein [Chondrinema litorale]|uniref:pectinesterase family protein n=1 Tax=Chondrinema litorale TaxID=2994555 RepID=UPI002543B95B|nr:pectinesterase family protein [Chondrinema litorale]UZR97789.1 pectinesterase family protein [Chondrinema litorale]
MKNMKWISILLLLVSYQLCAEDKFKMVVAQDGSGDFETIQEAINASKAFPPQRVVIFIKNGVYKEKVKVHSWNNKLSLIGESVENTIITYDDYFDKIDLGRNSTFYSQTLMVQGDDFIGENFTVKNTAGRVGQAVTVAVEADRCVFKNCKFMGDQDTLYAAGQNDRQYYLNCYIEGTTDFIFGAATAVFDSCTINSKSNSFITAASTPKGKPYGYVFRNCKITADEGVDEVYLGRPWRDYAKTVFINCELGAHILPVGWDNWSSPEKEKTTFYAEYGNTGKGAAASKRVGWSHQLSAKEAKKYTLENIFAPVVSQDIPLKDWVK